jgi:DNA-binding NarL/FixJ family response regulator
LRPTRLLYIENDPALLGILTRLLSRRPELEVLLATPSPAEALNSEHVANADVALIDLALGADQMNGVDLGLSLRRINPDIGIVIHSQHRLDHVAQRIPRAELMGWSTVRKTGDMAIDELVATLRSTAKGMSTRVSDTEAPSGQLDELTPRQRTIMGLAATGLRSTEIARRLNATHESIRKEMSKAYRVLVPQSSPEEDLRTLAILAYLRAQEHELENN